MVLALGFLNFCQHASTFYYSKLCPNLKDLTFKVYNYCGIVGICLFSSINKNSSFLVPPFREKSLIRQRMLQNVNFVWHYVYTKD